MIVDLRSIPEGSRCFEYLLDPDWWDPDEQIPALTMPVQIKIEIDKAGDKFVLSGELSGGLEVGCDRCLDAYQRNFKFVFRVFLALPSPRSDKNEIELSEEDLELDIIRGEEIELDDLVREQIYLSLPMKSLCSENCLGLCPVCGVNLNHGDCQCHREQGHPGFSELRRLKEGS